MSVIYFEYFGSGVRKGSELFFFNLAIYSTVSELFSEDCEMFWNLY